MLKILRSPACIVKPFYRPYILGRPSSCMQDLGWPLPEDQEYYALALLCLAGLCGIGRVHEHAPSEEEFEVVGEAVSNADRYYQLVNMSTTQRREDADQASRAFKITAAMWFEQKTVRQMPHATAHKGAHTAECRVGHVAATK